uniref:Secreted protein n=1 Tax=Steinernema glaseri TaxID=37863 RepID=A0A1I8AND6_9BILA
MSIFSFGTYCNSLVTVMPMNPTVQGSTPAEEHLQRPFHLAPSTTSTPPNDCDCIQLWYCNFLVTVMPMSRTVQGSNPSGRTSSKTVPFSHINYFHPT